jgi:DNA-3-methyladenine glycosylase
VIAGSKGQHASESNPLVAGIDFSADAVSVARALIGTTLVLDGVGGIIVETEAYDQREPAAHSYVGNTRRNAPLFGPPGRAYVYLSYGIHWCLNFVCREAGHGAGVLIRALEPTIGIPVMMQRRHLTDLKRLCSGPGRVGQALAVLPTLNSLALDAPPFELRRSSVKPSVLRGPRIGITKAVERHWRFGLKGSPFLSRPFAQVVRT